MIEQEIKGAASLATAFVGASTAWLETVDLIVSICAGTTATVAAGFAIYYYITRGRPEK